MAEGEFYKGFELKVPISDELREFLVARSKDTLLRRLENEERTAEHRRVMLAELKKAKAAENGESEEDGSEEDGEEEEYEEVPYDKWTNAELIAEINDRNTHRKAAGLEPLSTDGKKADLVNTIEQDDAETAE